MNLRKTMKFLHSLAAVGMTGALAAQLLILGLLPSPTEELAAYAALRSAMAQLGTWLLFPSLGLVLVSGLLAIAINRAFHDVGWVWLKLLLGVSAFEGTLVAVHGPLQREAERAAAALAGELEPAALLQTSHNEFGALLVVLGVAVANIVLGVYRPRFTRPQPTARTTPPEAASGS
ncbi:MAG: DUF2269 family protein [Pseudomonadales bacterium]|jgi:hypothetical protein|nr:DUF2269 family protein [Pseudomonadales bacterium]